MTVLVKKPPALPGSANDLVFFFLESVYHGPTLFEPWSWRHPLGSHSLTHSLTHVCDGLQALWSSKDIFMFVCGNVVFSPRQKDNLIN